MQLKNLGNSLNAIKDIQNVFDFMSNFKGLGSPSVTIDKLKQATSGYSVEVLKLAASQTTLTTAQAKAIFAAKGLKGAELDAAVSTATLSTAQKAATGTTLGLSTAFKGLLSAIIKKYCINIICLV